MSDEKRNPSRRRAKQTVPVGLERVLFVAAQDPAFRAELCKDAEQAVKARGLSLRESEWAMLRAVPAEQLLATVEGMDTSPSNVERRGFMRAVAAGAVAVAAAGCGETAVKGIQPDDATVDLPEATRGIRPDDAAVDFPPTMAGVRIEDSGPGDTASDTVQADIYSAVGDAGVRPDDEGL